MFIMSKATKRKHVAKEVLDEFVVPDDTRQVVKVHGVFLAIQVQQITDRQPTYVG